VQRLQRAHIALALVAVVVEDGHEDPAVADIVARAGVSRKSFYRLFDGKEDARREAAELLWLRAVHRVAQAAARQPDPVRRAHAGAVALSRLVTSHPRQARLVLSDPAILGLDGLLAVLDPSAPVRADVRTPADPADPGDRAVQEAILGEAGGPAALLARAGHVAHTDRLGAQGRRVLALLGDRPGVGGVEVQRALGHRHGSQTSRLLHRLRRQGLVTAVDGEERSRWSLTRAGRAALREPVA
jgi:AcrR family transcriptional regulator